MDSMGGKSLYELFGEEYRLQELKLRRKKKDSLEKFNRFPAVPKFKRKNKPTLAKNTTAKKKRKKGCLLYTSDAADE